MGTDPLGGGAEGVAVLFDAGEEFFGFVLGACEFRVVEEGEDVLGGFALAGVGADGGEEGAEGSDGAFQGFDARESFLTRDQSFDKAA